MNEIEKSINQIKARYGSTQRWIANEIGITSYYLSECKRGVRRPSQAIMDNLKILLEDKND